jgi:hypothetical protein
MQNHKLADTFPDMTPEEFAELCLSIETSGQREAIVAVGGKILDGRHRYKACVKLGIRPVVRQYDPAKDGTSPAQFVADRNLHRRSLTAGQRAAIGAELQEIIRAEREAAGGEFETRTREAAAKAAGCGETALAKAAKLKRDHPKQFAKVKAGEAGLDEAIRAADPSDDARNQSADRLAVEHGDEFAERVRGGVLLPGKNLTEFVVLSRADQRDIMPLVEKGWRPKIAVKFHRGIFGGDDTLGDVANFCDYRGGTAEVAMDGYRISIEAT